jgi:hypothetical protein
MSKSRDLSDFPAGALDIDASGNLDVDGTVTADGLAVDKTAQATIVATSDGTVDVRLVADTSLTEGSIRTSGTTPSLGFYVGGTNRMRIDSSGIVTMPYQPAFLCSAVSVNDIAVVSSGVTLDWDELFDQGNNFSSGTFTAPVEGKYQLQFVVRVDNMDNSTAYTRVILATSNRTYNQSIINPTVFTSDPDYWHFTLSILTNMDAGDTASVLYSQYSGTAQADIKNTSTFSGYLVA